MTDYTDAVLLDAAIQEIAGALKKGLPWLDNAFGRADRVKGVKNGRTYYTPAVYEGEAARKFDYRSMLPDQGNGSFSFFVCEDPQTVGAGPGPRELTSPFALVVWTDLRRVYRSCATRNVEALKLQVLQLLSAGTWKSLRRLTVTRIFDRAENIYKGFTLDEVDNQFLIQPFAGFRIEGTLYYEEPCR